MGFIYINRERERTAVQNDDGDERKHRRRKNECVWVCIIYVVATVRITVMSRCVGVRQRANTSQT